MDSSAVEAARARLKERHGSKAQIGGKGSVRRKQKVAKTASAVDKKLEAVLKRLNVQNTPFFDEVQFTKADGNFIDFERPRIQMNPQANLFVVSGAAEEKDMKEYLPKVLESIRDPQMQELLKQLQASNLGGAAAPAAADNDDDDEEMPELESENFEDAAK